MRGGVMEEHPAQQVLYATARALAESETLEEAAPRMLKAICEAVGWEYGAIWEAPRVRTVRRCVATWPPPPPECRESATATTQPLFPPGIGLPGRVWAGRAPAWIPDVTLDTNFPRAPFAERAGLHAAFA